MDATDSNGPVTSSIVVQDDAVLEEPLQPIQPLFHELQQSPSSTPPPPPEVMKLREFEYHYHRPPKEEDSFKNRIQKSIVLKCACSGECICKTIEDKLPIINMFKTYKFKKYILGDIIAGLSIGILQVPQGLSFALLAGLPPIYGLYTSFFPTIFYVLFGTSKHVSFGCTSLTGIMINSLVKKIESGFNAEDSRYYDHDSINGTMGVDIVGNVEEGIHAQTVQIVIGVTMLIGLMQVAMSIFRFGFVTTYLSDAILAGFVSAVSLHVYISQVKYLLGIRIKSRGGPLGIVFLVIEICKNLPMTNVSALIMSIICFIVLIVMRKCVNERYKDKLRVPIPIDLIVVIITTIISYFCKLSKNFDLETVKHIPNGLPEPVLPDILKVSSYVGDAFSIAIISFSGTFVMTRLFSQRNNYAIRPNQELLAIGMAHIFSSFFSCFGFTAVPARSFLHEAAGGKTQLAHIIAAVIVLLVMVFLSFLLRALPICVLACLVIVACLPLAGYFRFAKQYWETDKYDFISYLITFLLTLFLQIDYGLLAGIVFSLFSVVIRTQTGRSYVKERIKNTEFYVDKKKYDHVQEIPGVRVVYFEAPLYFATAEMMKKRLFHLSNVKMRVSSMLTHTSNGNRVVLEEQNVGPNHANCTAVVQLPVQEQGSRAGSQRIPMSISEIEVPLTLSVNMPSLSRNHGNSIHTVVLDCSSILYVDTAGLEVLLSAYQHYKGLGVTFCLANLTDGVKNKLKNVDKYFLLWKDCAYLSIHDAVTASVCARETAGWTENQL